MPENSQEQTEAKLLAYLEGELDDTGRAEIERHILADPRRRKLLDELSDGRALVRLLPREGAPANLFENVQAQLERQERLASDAKVNRPTGDMRLTRWGQIRAAAAVLLLATGLGLMVYNVVPKKEGGGGLAIRQNELHTPTPPPVTPADPRLDDWADGGNVAGSGEAGRGLLPAADRDTLRMQRMSSAVEEVRKLPAVRQALRFPPVDGAAAPAETVDKAALAAAGALPESSGHEPLYLVVASTSNARQDVVTLLSQRGLEYVQVARADDAAEDAAAIAARPRPPREPAMEKAASGGRSTDEQQQSPPAADAARQSTAAPADSVAATPPAAPRQEQTQGQFDGFARDVEQLAGEAGQPAGSAVQEVLIVRRVRRDHAAQLAADLNRPAAQRYAIAYAPGAPGGLAGQREAEGLSLNRTLDAGDNRAASLNESPARVASDPDDHKDRPQSLMRATPAANEAASLAEPSATPMPQSRAGDSAREFAAAPTSQPANGPVAMRKQMEAATPVAGGGPAGSGARGGGAAGSGVTASGSSAARLDERQMREREDAGGSAGKVAASASTAPSLQKPAAAPATSPAPAATPAPNAAVSPAADSAATAIANGAGVQDDRAASRPAADPPAPSALAPGALAQSAPVATMPPVPAPRTATADSSAFGAKAGNTTGNPPGNDYVDVVIVLQRDVIPQQP